MSDDPKDVAQLQHELDSVRRALDEERQAFLYTESIIPIGLALLRETDLAQLLEMILREGRRLSCADGATLYMRRGDVLEYFMVINISLMMEMGSAKGSPITFPPLPLTNPLTGKPNLKNVACFCVLRRETLNLAHIYESQDFDFSGSRKFDEMHHYHTSSLLTVPLAGTDGEILAVLQLVNAQDPATGRPMAFSSAIQRVIESLAALAAGALESFEVKSRLYQQQQLYLKTLETTQARLREELTEAEKYVRAVLPAPQEAPLKIDWLLEPCSELGGDSFGYHEIDEDHWALYILDVCGHGLAAALLSVTAAKIIRSGALHDVDFHDPGAVLTVLNNEFLMRDQNNFYFTIWYGVYQLSTRILRYSSAGHAPGIIVDPDKKTATKLEARGLVLGAREDKVYTTRTTTLPPGAVLYLISDGTYEIRTPKGELWPFAEFMDSLAKLPWKEEKALRQLHESIQKIRAPEPLEDDFSLIRICT